MENENVFLTQKLYISLYNYYNIIIIYLFINLQKIIFY
jgi:hypothetical protein